MSLNIGTDKKTMVPAAVITIAAISASSSLTFASAQTNSTSTSTVTNYDNSTATIAHPSGNCPGMGSATTSASNASSAA